MFKFEHLAGRKTFPQIPKHPTHSHTHTCIHLSQLAFMCVAGWLSKMRYIFIKRTTLCFNLSNRTHTNKQWKAPHTHTRTLHPYSDRLWFRSRHGLQISVPQRSSHGILHCFGQFAFTVINLNAPHTPILRNFYSPSRVWDS